MRTITMTLHYQALNRLPAVAKVDVYDNDGQQIVIASDIGTGPSVTNNVEVIATELRRHGITWDTFIEHYPVDDFIRREATFDSVTFTWQNDVASEPCWKHLSAKEITPLIGENI